MRTANFYKYVPKRFATADKGAESVRNFIYAFKDGRRDNGTEHVNIFGKREAKHNNPEHIVSESFGYAVSTDPDFFNGKNVILFDDLITTGTTAETFAEELEAVGANVLGAMFLARTTLFKN